MESFNLIFLVGDSCYGASFAAVICLLRLSLLLVLLGQGTLDLPNSLSVHGKGKHDGFCVGSQLKFSALKFDLMEGGKTILKPLLCPKHAPCSG